MATHKNFKKPEGDIFLSIQVGREGKKDLGYIGDNTGEHISNKNKTFCELTGLYWAWKNEDYDVLGLCHYRRYFDLKRNNINDTVFISQKELNKYPFEKEKVVSILNKYDLILPKAKTYQCSIEKDYGYTCSVEDFEILTKTINNIYPKYSKSWDQVANFSNKLMHYNMFIAPKKIVDEYCTWLFSILFEVEKEVKLSPYNYQQRVFGFMAERLMQLYFTHNKFKVKHLTVLYVKDEDFKYSTPSKTNTFLSNSYKNFLFFLTVFPIKIKRMLR
ncbi:MAG: DUF4422 domain-containing protein [Flavobacteriaceae bacterium]|nr:DUF4422 domain-containing protein [Flavobacteriaceae bacterium]